MRCVKHMWSGKKITFSYCDYDVIYVNVHHRSKLFCELMSTGFCKLIWHELTHHLIKIIILWSYDMMLEGELCPCQKLFQPDWNVKWLGGLSQTWDICDDSQEYKVHIRHLLLLSKPKKKRQKCGNFRHPMMSQADISLKGSFEYQHTSAELSGRFDVPSTTKVSCGGGVWSWWKLFDSILFVTLLQNLS